MTNAEKLEEALNDFLGDVAIKVAKDSIEQWDELLDQVIDSTEKCLNKHDDAMNVKLILLTKNLKHFNKFDLAGLATVLMCKVVELQKEKSDDDKSQA